MAGPDFKTSLETQIKTILLDYVGQGGQWSDPVNFVTTWDNKVPEIDINENVPLVVIVARRSVQLPRNQGEMGTSRELWNWYVDIYYLDVEQNDYETGYARQGDIVNRIRNGLENEVNLRGLSVPVNPTSPTGAFSEKVYNNDWQSFDFDSSGQDGYWTFTAIGQLLVQTSRN